MQANSHWIIGIDRGGTFTDIVARDPHGELITFKLLSEDPTRYDDAAIFALRQLLNQPDDRPLPQHIIHSIRMGTTVATNALLEHTGVPICLVTTKGFRDILEIGHQARSHLFELNIKKPLLLYQRVIEIDERMDATGGVIDAPNPEKISDQLQTVYDDGFRALAIVFLNTYQNDTHEQLVKDIARQIGFTQISCSAETMRVQKMVSRGDTTLVDAYLNPILQKYVRQVRKHTGTIPLKFMKSGGGLVDADMFTAKDAIISGPAGGVIGYARIARMLNIDKVIGFDMGGTSTDVSRYDSGTVEKVYETETAGVRIQTPMINVVTVAAGGGSVLHFDGLKLTVGPDSAGANPGPACYRNGGPLAVTDANLMLGRILPEFFPNVFGPNHDASLDVEIVTQRFDQLSEKIFTATGLRKSPHEVALGFIRIANENMIKPIKEISVAKGFNIQEYTLCCFGGAGAQHACAIARALGIKRILLHPFAGVLSAYGMMLADVTHEDTRAVLLPFDETHVDELKTICTEMSIHLRANVIAKGIEPNRIRQQRYVDIRPKGTDTAETILFDEFLLTRQRFLAHYKQHYGFLPTASLEVVNVRVEVIGEQIPLDEPIFELQQRTLIVADAKTVTAVYFDDGWHQQTPVFDRTTVQPGNVITGPALIIEPNSTLVIEPDFQATINERGHLVLEKIAEHSEKQLSTACDPILLEIFNNLFMSIAEQMGKALQRTAHSVNIKERLDFSCAVFDATGGLVANAPHIPVHLGAMGESVAHVIHANQHTMRPGDVYVTNDPYHGGSHLPDVTVVTPVFDENNRLLFCVASRGHHADIGGITPGSMPPFSKTLAEEGIVFDNVKLVSNGVFDEAGIIGRLKSGPYPARNLPERLSDLRAQVAANIRGVQELQGLIEQYGVEVVHAYMGHVQMNAETAMRRAIATLADGEHRAEDRLDNGTTLRVCITIHGDTAHIDFAGTDPQISTNLNAPPAVTRAAVLYVFRTLIEDNIPLNAGCFAPVTISIPEGSVLNPLFGAAVAGGNVETSQRVVDVLYRALGIVAASQGTMNNFTFGETGFGYYETIAGGAGAGPGFDGAHAVHTHMTNTRITDPEVLEHRFPEIRLDEFSIRRGSGGSGYYCGGDGIVRQFQFLQPRTVSLLTERRVFAPFGVNGAEAGSTGKNILIHTDNTIENLGGKVQRLLEPGERIRIETPGAGGYNLNQNQLQTITPENMRWLIRNGRWDKPTSGLCLDYVQTNVLIVPKAYAADFEAFCRANPKACPLLELLPAGNPIVQSFASGADIRSDVPTYHIYRYGRLSESTLQIYDFWQDDFVTFLIGCSFTFEAALVEAGIPVRHMELQCNVPMYNTTISCVPVGPFGGNMVVSMRPMKPDQVLEAYHVTAAYPAVHGAPLCRKQDDPETMITDPVELGISDITQPDFGDAVPLSEEDVTVFWACGVTSQMAALHANLPIFISHAPGHMFITDRKHQELMEKL
ncbi:putative hydro-lyase [candidate division KSB1 bacterium]|nr:putative hydro-lyase [candidate division KSB1 bacterium]